MTAGRIAALALLAVIVRAALALVPQVGWMIDPLLAVTVLAAISGRRWQGLLTGLILGAISDA